MTPSQTSSPATGTRPIRTGGLFETPLTPARQTNTQRNLAEAREGATELTSYPRRVLLEVTNLCNYRCIMCGRCAASFRPSCLDVEVVDRLAPVWSRCEEVTLFGWGEPTCHPEFGDFLRRLRDQAGLRTYMLTNGSNLDYVTKIVRRGWLDILAVSLDGATAEMNDTIRAGADFDYITGKLRALTSLADEGVALPFMNLVFCAMRRNMHQLPDMVRLTAELGLPELKVVYLTSFDGQLAGEVVWGAAEQFNAFADEARQVADALGILLKLPPAIGADCAGERPHKECHVAWRDLFVGSDGSVRPCQSSPTELAHLTELTEATEPGFMSLWNSDAFRRFRAGVNAADPAEMDPPCRTCFQSSHANWNLRSTHLQGDPSALPTWK